jgi:hypothetical protein
VTAPWAQTVMVAAGILVAAVWVGTCHLFAYRDRRRFECWWKPWWKR